MSDHEPIPEVDPSASMWDEHEFIHLDNSDEVDEKKRSHIYLYEDEERYDELSETINEMRKNYIFTAGIVWPSWMREEMPLETDVLLALEREAVFNGELTPELLEEIQKEVTGNGQD